jgi:hypothetical protein
MFNVPSFFGFKAGSESPPDPDALAFFARVDAATATTDFLTITEKSAIDTLVKQMKSYGIWTSMKAIYPMVGGGTGTLAQKQAACEQNLVSSSFTGSFSSGWTFSSTGVLPNGTSAFFNTTLNPNVELLQNSNHLSFYSRTSNAVSTTIEIGSLNTSPASFFHSHIYYSDGVNVNRYFMLLAQSTTASVANASSLGFFNGNRKNSTTVSHFKNGSNIGDLTSISVALNNRAVYIGAGNINGSSSNFSNRECAFASIGDGLTDTEAPNFYTAVQAFQTTLSRQV